ncbi:malto-oligosyltrehalose trehalohydrolase [Rhodopseudomonas boonkerdii]|uniref:malto-oligosyltrehalose trehalohydrolase n=1 Tax=Rhodopseudomonas boonkerdii TaxID=475937 RepID=UPI001E5E06FB|nr:malto-oligosyltrehalose trehalohydrolase [Rhodopseudomonas boonkerdii]UGV25647.1 malto-oligosyltrehalose trehalohydrolase [Rhodopseudomonas boonkerdii]
MSTRSFGPQLTDKGATFRLWAPATGRVEVIVDKPYPMTPQGDGWHGIDVPGVSAGATYRFRIDGRIDVPDPGSSFQPQDVSGPSEIVDHAAYQWRAPDWRGRPWDETVLLETHVGTFTADGTYRAMIDKLDHIVKTGITALELMPLADFAGSRNWGYDGVLWYAPDHVYGRPDDLKALIDEAHLRGLSVFLDVVYNHFGPEGNYLGLYAPTFFCGADTPWGSAIDYRVPQARAYAIENALMWLRDYRFDGLRLDAVHAIAEPGEIPMLHELSREVGKFAADTGRQIHLMLENDDNRATLLDPATNPPRGKYRAQWNDDYHHAWHVLLTGEDKGYYSDYVPTPVGHVVQALGSGFSYQGQPSAHRDGAMRGEPSGALPPSAFVNFLQNHDQIGNRALGERLEAIAEPLAIEAALAITLLAPMVPMLFQGEEWGSKVPFPFFCDFRGDLADAVRSGRREEFANAYEQYGDDVPDPLDAATFEHAKIDWEMRGGAGRRRWAMVRDLLRMRKQHIVPRSVGARFGKVEEIEGLLIADWRMGDDTRLLLRANLSDKQVTASTTSGTLIWGRQGDVLAPWAIQWWMGDK